MSPSSSTSATDPASSVPRPFAASLAVALLSLGTLAATAMIDPAAPITAHAIVSAVAVALCLVPRIHGAARSIAVLTAALACTFPLVRVGVPWQAIMPVALAGWALATRRWPALAPSASWRARGGIPWGWTAVVAGVTPIALLTWLQVMQPDLSDVVGAYVPDLPFAVLVVGAVGFATINAAGEELIWRGVLQDRLAVLVGLRAAVVLQAISFGLQHAHGVPRGPLGIVLAGSWAVMLGLLRLRSRGLLAPLLAHIVADAVIATIVLTLARS